jgi:hypothetical protein
LLGRLERDSLPTLNSLFSIVNISQPDVGKLGHHGHNTSDTQLSQFLRDQVKFFSFEQCYGEGQCQW